jgi:hypothetical protein
MECPYPEKSNEYETWMEIVYAYDSLGKINK